MQMPSLINHTASAKSGKNKIIIFGAAGAVILIALVTTLIILLSGDDENGENQVVENDESSELRSEDDDSSTNSGSENSGSAGKNISLVERIPTDSGAVFFIRVNDLLEKGRDDIAALLPPGLPPMVGKALENPAFRVGYF